MRDLCTDLLDDLNRPGDGTAPVGELLGALCSGMARRVGRPITHVLVPMPPGTVSGLLIRTTDADLVVCERHTSALHQVAITGHELWHMEAGSVADAPLGDAAQVLFPHLGTQALARIAARRHICGRGIDHRLWPGARRARSVRRPGRVRPGPATAVRSRGRLPAVAALRRVAGRCAASIRTPTAAAAADGSQ
jgi:hypothetical protein